MRHSILLIILALVSTPHANEPPTDIGYFKNETTQSVLVYLSAKVGRYYGIFGVGAGSVNGMAITPGTVAVVTLMPGHEKRCLSQAPELPAIARSKLFIPARTVRDRAARKLFYSITEGKIRLVSWQEAKN